jgi:GNAT superfamily N-acetyltransferase
MTKIQKGYIPGSIGRIAEMHGKYYAENWQFGHYFEAKVATELSEFVTRYDPKTDGIWVVVQNGRVEGSIVIDGVHTQDEDAHLRWFIASDELQGKGYGNRLLQEAIVFCKAQNYPRVYLWTFEGLDAARKLYEKAGFVLECEKRGQQWGTEVTEQKFILRVE